MNYLISSLSKQDIDFIESLIQNRGECYGLLYHNCYGCPILKSQNEDNILCYFENALEIANNIKDSLKEEMNNIILKGEKLC